MTDITYVKRLSGNGATAFAIEANAKMIEYGVASEKFAMVAWDDQAMLAFEDGVLIGIITFYFIEWRSEIAIKLGFVSEEHRNKGIYRLLWNALVEKAKELNAQSITGVTYVRNYTMRDVANKLGREEISINLYYPVGLSNKA